MNTLVMGIMENGENALCFENTLGKGGWMKFCISYLGETIFLYFSWSNSYIHVPFFDLCLKAPDTLGGISSFE